MSTPRPCATSCTPPFLDPPGYPRHRQESTLLYQFVEQHFPAFRKLRAEADVRCGPIYRRVRRVPEVRSARRGLSAGALRALPRMHLTRFHGVCAPHPRMAEIVAHGVAALLPQSASVTTVKLDHPKRSCGARVATSKRG
jgi:hypothetical protein